MRKVGLGDTGDTAPTGRGRTKGSENVFQGGGPSNITVWFRNVDNFFSNGKE